MKSAQDRVFDPVLFGACAGVILAALTLGGGAAPDRYLGDVIIQFVAIPALIYALFRLAGSGTKSIWRAELWLIAAIVLIPILQLIPLPPVLWHTLPFSEARSLSLELTGDPSAWAPLSLTPGATLGAALSLAAPLAVFLSTIQLSRHDRRMLSIVILTGAIFSAAAGLLQSSQTGADAVGIFANRNHFSALLYAALPFAAIWALDHLLAISTADHDLKTEVEASRAIYLALAFAIVAALIAAQFLARSRAGIVLTMVALAGVLVVAYADRRRSAFAGGASLIAVALAAIVVFSLQFALYRMMQRFSADPLADARVTMAANGLSALKSTLPFGSGLGSFVPVYATLESADEALLDRYINHAHNDPLELLIETGVAGAAVLGAFLIWFASRALKVWRQSRRDRDIDRNLARAATLIIVLLLCHALVDYHLRTAALMVTFAFVAALLVEAPHESIHSGVRRNAGAATSAAAIRPDQEHIAHAKSGSDAHTPAPSQTWAHRNVPVPQHRDLKTKPDFGWPGNSVPPADSKSAEPGTPPTAKDDDTAFEWPLAWRKPDDGKKHEE